MAQEIHTQLCCDWLSCVYISSSDSIPYTHIYIHKHTHINTHKTEHAYIGNGIAYKGTDWIDRRGISSFVFGLIGSFNPWPDLHVTRKYEVVRILLIYAWYLVSFALYSALFGAHHNQCLAMITLPSPMGVKATNTGDVIKPPWKTRQDCKNISHWRNGMIIYVRLNIGYVNKKII